jgi:hypothetical protein
MYVFLYSDKVFSQLCWKARGCYRSLRSQLRKVNKILRTPSAPEIWHDADSELSTLPIVSLKTLSLPSQTERLQSSEFQTRHC